MTQKEIAEARKLYDIPDNFIPVVTVSGVCTAWVKA